MQTVVKVLPLASLRTVDLTHSDQNIRVIFVRHARGRHQNWGMALLYFLNFGKDPSLTAAGIMQCQNFPHRWLFGVSGLKVLSSPLRRCKETIGKLTDFPFQIEPLVREISGSSEDRYANVQDPFLWADRGIFCYESREHARYRVCQFLATKEAGGLYFVMTHKWFIYEVLSFFELKPFMTGNLEGVFLEFPANQSAGRLPEQIKRYPFFKVLAKGAIYSALITGVAWFVFRLVSYRT